MFLLALNRLVQHENLVDVEDYPGYVTHDEDEDDADEDEGQVHLGGPLRVSLPRPLVGHLDACNHSRLLVATALYCQLHTACLRVLL